MKIISEREEQVIENECDDLIQQKKRLTEDLLAKRSKKNQQLTPDY